MRAVFRLNQYFLTTVVSDPGAFPVPPPPRPPSTRLFPRLLGVRQNSNLVLPMVPERSLVCNFRVDYPMMKARRVYAGWETLPMPHTRCRNSAVYHSSGYNYFRVHNACLLLQHLLYLSTLLLEILLGLLLDHFLCCCRICTSHFR